MKSNATFSKLWRDKYSNFFSPENLISNLSFCELAWRKVGLGIIYILRKDIGVVVVQKMSLCRGVGGYKKPQNFSMN